MRGSATLRSMIAREAFNHLVAEADFDAVLSLFDENSGAVRRLLTRLTYEPDSLLQKHAIQAFFLLSKERAGDNYEFFREIIRSHIWGMNDESGNIDWSAPEIMGAIIAGRLDLFGEFVTIMYHTAAPEPIFHDSLLAALELIATVDPEAAAPYREDFLRHDTRAIV